MRAARFTMGLVATPSSVGAAAFIGCSSESADNPAVEDGGADATADALPLLDASPADAGSDVTDSDTPEPFFDCTQDSAVEAPNDLRCTGLYDRWTKKTIRADVKEYAPGFTLWSDGAVKTRWIYLPPGTKIDTTDMDGWIFPVGTKTWKEFVLGGKRVETRLYWKIATSTWVKTTYRWSTDESAATRLDTGFTTNDAGDPDASDYEIPSVGKCDSCHNGAADDVLGFEAVGLGVAGATGYTLANLVADGRLTTNPATTTLAIPEDGTGKAKNALGWMHANCGTSCHNTNPNATCFFKGMHLRLTYTEVSAATAVTSLDAYVTTSGVASTLNGSNPAFRIANGNPAASAVYVLANQRNNTSGLLQMPPIDSHKVDPTGTGYVNSWITALP